MAASASIDIGHLAESTVLASVLGKLRASFGGYSIVDHWKQGEFHHDLVLRVAARKNGLPGDILVVSTNCNGGVKELLCFGEVPDRWALWHHRCPDVAEFEGTLPDILGQARTPNWYDPCGLLGENGPQ